jgi:adenosylcobinamide-phosphate synthase
VGLIGGSGLIGLAIATVGMQLQPLVGAIVQGILLASCFAARGLRWAALDVLEPLESGDLDQARHQLSRYVGRDTDQLDAGEIRRAVLETIAENTTDGVTAPLFYAILGLWLGIGPLPLAIAYKAASTLDSMIGYRRDPFHDLGWFSAQLEDRLTWLPCRLTVGLLALISRQPRHVLTLCRRDAPQDPSPNSGWSECAYAAALGVQLGGLNTYRGELRPKPLLGDPIHPITSDGIDQALAWMRSLFLWELAIGGIGVALLLALS